MSERVVQSENHVESSSLDQLNSSGASPVQTIVYIHGFLSSAKSTKGRYLKERLEAVPRVAYLAIDFNPTPRDFETMTTTGQINRLRQYVIDYGLSEISFVASSFGGLIALHYAHLFGGVKRMLLLAPAVIWLSGGLSEQELRQWEQAGAVPVLHPAFEGEVHLQYDLQLDGLRYLDPVPPAAPTVIIHGRQDSTVPFAHSQAYAAAYPDRVRLIQVEADHDLNHYLDLIWTHVESFLIQGDAGHTGGRYDSRSPQTRF